MAETAQTVDREFKIIEESDEELLLKITSELKKGMKVAVPKEASQYNSELQSEVEGLEVGQKIDAVLVSENETNTAWRFYEIAER